VFKVALLIQASDHQKNPNDKKTPEENIQLIRMYGGIQFPGTALETTPRHFLRRDAAEAVRSPSRSSFYIRRNVAKK
jgi:hypothetical protein